MEYAPGQFSYLARTSSADSTDAPDVDDEMEDEDGRFFGGGLNNEQQVSCLSFVDFS